MKFSFPPEKQARVIVNTDAKNEADDQYAIVHALLTPSFELHGIIPAHFGTHKSATSMRDSHDEVMKLLRLLVFWLYYSSVILVLGAELASVLQDVHPHAVEPKPRRKRHPARKP